MAATYEPIATTTLSTTAADVSFTSISGSFTDLLLVFNFEITSPGAGTNINIQFNSDTGSNYSHTVLYGDGSSAASTRGSNTTGIPSGFDATSISGNITRINIQNYSNTTTYKSVIMRPDSSGYVVARVGLWRNTNAITSIRLYPDSSTLTSGSTFTLYGIASA